MNFNHWATKPPTAVAATTSAAATDRGRLEQILRALVIQSSGKLSQQQLDHVSRPQAKHTHAHRVIQNSPNKNLITWAIHKLNTKKLVTRLNWLIFKIHFLDGSPQKQSVIYYLSYV